MIRIKLPSYKEKRCRELSLTLNLQKIKLRLSQVPFVGHLLTADGAVTDPNKVRTIRDIPTPKDGKSLKISWYGYLPGEALTKLVNWSLRMLNGVGCLFMMKLSKVSRILFVMFQC